MIKCILLFYFFIFTYTNSYAATCASPVGQSGMIHNDSGNLKYCDDFGSWVSMNSEDGALGLNCFTPGLIVKDQYCNGTNFVNMSSQFPIGSCAGEREYTLKYMSGSFAICLLTQWISVGFCWDCNVFGGPAVNCPSITTKNACIANNCEWVEFDQKCYDIPSTDPVEPPSEI